MRSATRLTIYNHKGGVGKTTLSVNIGAALAAAGARVLLVDSDPQCNLTSFFFPDDVVDDLLNNSDAPSGTTIWSALKPVFDGTGAVKVVEPIETSVEGLYVLPGDIRLSEFEQGLGDAWNDCFKRRAGGYRTTASLSNLVSQLVEAMGFDFVMYDTGPNIGPLNRVILLDCDFFIVPVACDLFSTRALATLGQTLKGWIVDWQTITSIAPDGVELLQGRPKFAGYVPLRFKVYGQRMAQAPSFYLRRVQRQIYSEVVNVLRGVSKGLAPDPSLDTKLGEVREFTSLAITSQREGVPLYLATGPQDQRDAAQQAFAELTAKIKHAVKGRKRRPAALSTR